MTRGVCRALTRERDRACSPGSGRPKHDRGEGGHQGALGPVQVLGQEAAARAGQRLQDPLPPLQEQSVFCPDHPPGTLTRHLTCAGMLRPLCQTMSAKRLSRRAALAPCWRSRPSKSAAASRRPSRRPRRSACGPSRTSPSMVTHTNKEQADGLGDYPQMERWPGRVSSSGTMAWASILKWNNGPGDYPQVEQWPGRSSSYGTMARALILSSASVSSSLLSPPPHPPRCL